MKAMLVIDSPGPNPEFDPPDPNKDKEAFLLYDVPHTILVPAGTILDGPMCWVHCLPDSAIPPVIRAVPLDDAAKTMVERKRKTISEKHKAALAAFEKRLPALLDDIEKRNQAPAKAST